MELLYVCWFIKPLFDENIGIRNQVMVILIYDAEFVIVMDPLDQ